jgi:hypothetical protein
MSPELQLARGPRHRFAYGHHPLVQSSATHAFVIDNLSLPNSSWFRFVDASLSISNYPMDDVELLFAALRIASGADTGYAQLIVVPKDWASSYDAHLMPITVKAVKQYPQWFETGSWELDREVGADTDELKIFTDVFQGLRNLDRNGTRVGLAIRRLNQAFLREDQHDAILDICIGMEALLSDGNEEMTHKLAMRIAAFCKYAGISDQSPSTIFREVKIIYKYRSAVVHGDVKAIEKRKDITREDEGTLPTMYLAREYFRYILIAISVHKQFVDPQRIDFDLLLGDKIVPNTTNES